MKNNLISSLKFIIGWPISLISIFFIAKLIYTNSSAISNLKSLNVFFVLISVILYIVYFFLRTILWNEIIHEKGNKLPYKDTMYFWQISEVKRYTPGNIWSFLSRATLFTKNNLTTKDLFACLIREGVLLIIGCFILSSFYISSKIGNSSVILLLLFLTTAGIIFFLFSKKILSVTSNGNLKNILILILPDKNYANNLKLLLISILTFFFYGLGTYFSAISIIYIDPHNLINSISLFIFSFFLGYISIITPMGLGVREGIMTAGLSSYILAPIAAVISVFSRILLILSEVIFLLFGYLWHKTKSDAIDGFVRFILKNKYSVLILLLTLIYITYFTAATFLRYDNFFAGRFDLGNMDQTVWNTIHGRIFNLTDPNGTDMISRLSIHADFILILISPLYFIWSNPKMLLLLQTIVLAFGAYYVFLISVYVTKNNKFSLIISAAYLLNPALQFTNLYDFHAVTLATTILLGSFYYLLKKRYLLMSIFLLMAAITKEEIWIYFSIFGLAIMIRQLFNNKKISFNKETFLALLYFFSGFLIFYELIWKIIPHFRGGDHFALSYYSDFGGSVSGIAKNILLNPIKIILIILHKDNIEYLIQIFGSLGFVSLIGFPFLFFATPDFAINLLSSNQQLHQVYYQYSAAITPFIFISAIFGAYFINKKINTVPLTVIAIYIFFSTLIAQYFVGPMPFSLHPNIDMFSNQLSYGKEINEFIESIPTKYSISATNNLGSHLSRRRNIYTIPIGIDKADVVLFLLNDKFALPSPEALREEARRLQQDKNYVQVYKKYDFIVFEKRNLYINPEPKPKKGQVKLFPYSIPALTDRGYEGSQVNVERKISSGESFNSYIVSFNSDGLKEYALMNVPNTNAPTNGFPVLILNHGYIRPDLYSTENSYKTEADYFAKQGFIVLKPDYRGNANSEIVDTSIMRFVYPVDVLNLISSVKNISNANPNNIYLWSHSMGGEVTLEVVEIASKNDDFKNKIKGAVFWAPVTDPIKWFSLSHLPLLPEAKLTPYPYSRTFEVLGRPEENPELWNSLSPLNYLSKINIPLLIQHGTADTTVPYSWSVELNDALLKLNKNVNFLSYTNDTHNLPSYWSDAMSDDLSFFKSLQN